MRVVRSERTMLQRLVGALGDPIRALNVSYVELSQTEYDELLDEGLIDQHLNGTSSLDLGEHGYPYLPVRIVEDTKQTRARKKIEGDGR